MTPDPASKKHESRKRAYRRKDPERRRGERKWYDPAVRRESHAILRTRRAFGGREER
jgi:hypothetical protein